MADIQCHTYKHQHLHSMSFNLEEVKNGVPQGLTLGLLFCFLFYIDLSKIAAKYTKIILYVDDTRIIVINLNPDGFKIAMNKIYIYINKWFRTNLSSLNLKKKKKKKNSLCRLGNREL